MLTTFSGTVGGQVRQVLLYKYMVLFVVDLVLKSNCSSAKILFLLLYSQSWIYIVFSSTLENEVRIDIGLLFEIFSLSTFLNQGFISEYFKQSVKIPDDNDLLQMWFRGEIMKGEIIFNNFVDISSYHGNCWIWET